LLVLNLLNHKYVLLRLYRLQAIGNTQRDTCSRVLHDVGLDAKDLAHSRRCNHGLWRAGGHDFSLAEGDNLLGVTRGMVEVPAANVKFFTNRC
jgi:hypothetical protein